MKRDHPCPRCIRGQLRTAQGFDACVNCGFEDYSPILSVAQASIEVKTEARVKLPHLVEKEALIGG